MRYFWSHEQGRAITLQLLLLALVMLVGWALVSNTIDNLARQNVTSGFGFLGDATGFDVNQTLISYDETSSYGRLLLVGLLNTLLVSAMGIGLATLLGFFIGVLRLSTNWLVAQIAAIYIEIFRNLPLLIQILFWYAVILHMLPSPRQSFGLADMVFLNKRGLSFPALEPTQYGGWFVLGLLIFISILCYLYKADYKVKITTGASPYRFKRVLCGGVIGLVIGFAVFGAPFSLNVPALAGFNFRGGFTFIPEFVALVGALSIYTAAFIAEIVRSGINAVNRGQIEAARALGLTHIKTLRLIILPQAFRVIIPPLTSQYLNLIKNSSLAAAIAYPELVSTFAGTALNQTGQAIEIIFITMSIYLGLSLLTSIFMNFYNKRIALVER